jgi:hypothetical protein
MSVMTVGCRVYANVRDVMTTQNNVEERVTSAGPAPMPFKMQAPIKLPYDLALARQIMLPRQMRVENNTTGRLPKDELMGTLGKAMSKSKIALILFYQRGKKKKTHQMKLLNPNIKMATPVNWTTFIRFESKSWMS